MKIAIITASPRPIPATQGGATQTMMTHLLSVNEELKTHLIDVFSYYEFDACELAKEYHYSSFYYYRPNTRRDYLQELFWRVLRKITNEYVYLRSNFVEYCAKIINKSDYDAVILEGNCFQVQQIRKLVLCKLILHMHIDRLNNELKSTKRMMSACDGLFAISEFCKQRMLDVYENYKNPILVVKNTIDVSKFKYRGDNVRAEMRKKYGISDQQFVISYCGRIVAEKGVLELIQAVRKLNNPHVTLMIIGSSVYQGGKTTPYVENVAEEAKSLAGGVVLTGYVPQKELPDLISSCDLAAVPSICYEAAGNVTIEALACEIPVLASSQGGIPEYADTKGCVLVDYDKNFVSNLSKQIETLISNKELYASLKSNARGIALQYDKYNYYNNFFNAVAQVIK
jgi:glycosyltransferase involved in cell wall biosynthesis